MHAFSQRGKAGTENFSRGGYDKNIWRVKLSNRKINVSNGETSYQGK